MTYIVQHITLESAKLIADAAEAKATALGITVAIAIMDQHRNLKYFRRMDKSSSICVQMSQLKASTSAAFPVSTKDLGLRNETQANKPYLAVPGVVLLEGGLPITNKKNEHIGSIGISGATPELDGQVAQAGLAAFAG